jgi:D-ribose pyranose/furanose isomerase RbsD
MANAIENRVFSDELPVEDVGFPVPGWASKRVQYQITLLRGIPTLTHYSDILVVSDILSGNK